MAPFKLNFAKALQAAAVLLRTEPNYRMNYMKLLKLLYIADRESLKEAGRPITWDVPVAMQRGTLLSGIYDLIKGEHVQADKWEEFIQKDRYELMLKQTPGVGYLSKYEMGKLREVAERYAACDEFEMAEKTHEFDEWKQNQPGGPTSRRIPLRDILQAVGRSEIEADLISEAENAAKVDRILAQHREAGRYVSIQAG